MPTVNKGNLTDSEITDWIKSPATSIFLDALEEEEADLRDSVISYFVEGDMEKTFSSIAEVSGALKQLVWLTNVITTGTIFREDKPDPRLVEIELHDKDY